MNKTPHATADDSALDGISPAQQGWQRATLLQQHAARVGFDWPDAGPVLAKLGEELDEVRAEFAAGSDPLRLEDEIGDMLFVLVNLCRHAGVDFAQALQHANWKFEWRFRGMERLAKGAGTSLQHLSLIEQERLWQRVKTECSQPAGDAAG